MKCDVYIRESIQCTSFVVEQPVPPSGMVFLALEDACELTLEDGCEILTEVSS